MTMVEELALEFLSAKDWNYTRTELHEYYSGLLKTEPDERIAQGVFTLLTGKDVSGAGRLISPAIFEARLERCQDKITPEALLTIRYVYEGQNGHPRHVKSVTMRDLNFNPSIGKKTKELAWQVLLKKHKDMDDTLLSYDAGNHALRQHFGKTVTLKLLGSEYYHGTKHTEKAQLNPLSALEYKEDAQ